MRLLLSALLLAAVPVGFAQLQTATASAQAGGLTSLDLQSAPPSPDQTGCPVVLTQAHLNRPGTYLPVTSAEVVKEPNLSLGFQNESGKAIRSIVITAEMNVKKDVYALDATPVAVQLSFAGSKDLDKELSQLATIPLPKGLHEYGVARVRLDQVIFDDGSLWMAPAGSSCGLSTPNGLEQLQAR